MVVTLQLTQELQKNIMVLVGLLEVLIILLDEELVDVEHRPLL